MKSAYFTIHPGKISSSSKWLPVEIRFVFVFKNTGFTSSTFPIQPDFSQDQPATHNTGSPRTTLLPLPACLVC
jgi:hypothetical protein